jgi:hypothetical protein
MHLETSFGWASLAATIALALHVADEATHDFLAWLRPVRLALAAIHIANGLPHVSGSILAKRLVPGVQTATLLLCTGAWLGYAAASLS